MLRIDGTFLRSGVGRRIFALFLLACALPMALVITFTYRGVAGLLAREASAQLVHDSKNAAMHALERLQAARDELRAIDPGDGIAAPPTGMFRAIALLEHGDLSYVVAGNAATKDVFRNAGALAQRQPGVADIAVVAVPDAGGGEPILALVETRALAAGASAQLVGLLDPIAVFGENDLLPAQTELCVFEPVGDDLHCSDHGLATLAHAAMSSVAGVSLRAPDGHDRDVGAWTLHLNTDFRGAPWTFVSMRPVVAGAFDGREIGRTYVALGLACLLFVSALSLSQIRRILVPLERLVDGARRLRDGDFTQPIAVETHDEFGRLTAAFNDMALSLAERDRRLVHEARHDSLTDLPNRRRLHEIVDRRIAAHAAGAPDAFALLFIDLDRFKGVNDALGHDSGDELLRIAAQRIRECMQPHDILARLGGDEFIVVTAVTNEPGAPAELANRIIRSVADAFYVGGLDVHVGASVGVALFPEHGTSREALLRNADIAMYSAKKAGRGRCMTFQETMGETAVELFVLEKDLRAALAADEFQVAYQPRIDLASGAFAGAEALARWSHAQRGNVSPAVFIALAEESGLIDALGGSILSKACQQLAVWRRSGLHVPRVSINISARQLHSRNLIHLLRDTVAAAGLRSGDFELEITESALVDDVEAGRSVLERLHDAGFRIAMDDFGTGYSSLSYLRTLPIQILKLDRSFLKDVEHDRRSRALVEAIITMAHGLDIRVVAEGVESAGQARLLRALGCDEGQGYLFARPMFAAQLEEFAAHQVTSLEDTKIVSPGVV